MLFHPVILTILDSGLVCYISHCFSFVTITTYVCLIGLIAFKYLESEDRDSILSRSACSSGLSLNFNKMVNRIYF